MEIGTQHVLFAWSDIQEYRAIPTVDYRFTKAKQVRRRVRCLMHDHGGRYTIHDAR